MSIPRNERPFYVINFNVGDMDLSLNVTSVKLASSIASVYPAVVIEFEIDAAEMVLEKIYGQESITLSIKLTTEDQDEKGMFEFNLINVDIKSTIEPKGQNQESDHQESNHVKLTCVIKEAFKAMNTTINRLIDESKEFTPIEALQDIIDNCTDISPNIIDKNKNTEKIYQIIIPPMTLSKSIKYLDEYFGIFNGPMNSFCTVLDGDIVLTIADLSHMIKDEEKYKIHLLTEGGDESKIYEESDPTNNVFYVYNPMVSKYEGNKQVMKNAYKQRYVSLPMDKLFHNIDFTVDDVYNDNSVQSASGGDFYYNDDVKERYQVHTNHTGYETTETFARADLARSISNLTYLTFELHRNMDISELIKIGVPILIEPHVAEYDEYKGKYIVSSSYAVFERSSGTMYDCHVRNKCFRGNVLETGGG